MAVCKAALRNLGISKEQQGCEPEQQQKGCKVSSGSHLYNPGHFKCVVMDQERRSTANSAFHITQLASPCMPRKIPSVWVQCCHGDCRLVGASPDGHTWKKAVLENILRVGHKTPFHFWARGKDGPGQRWNSSAEVWNVCEAAPVTCDQPGTALWSCNTCTQTRVLFSLSYSLRGKKKKKKKKAISILNTWECLNALTLFCTKSKDCIKIWKNKGLDKGKQLWCLWLWNSSQMVTFL